MKIKVTMSGDYSVGKLVIDDAATFHVTNRLKTLREGTRKSTEVVRSIPANLPYDPQHFPKGKWRVTGVDWQREKGFDPATYGPCKIRTDAWQMVKPWTLDDEGDYEKETSGEVRDTCYWLHYSRFNTTLGCLRIASAKDAETIGNLISSALQKKEDVSLEVA